MKQFLVLALGAALLAPLAAPGRRANAAAPANPANAEPVSLIGLTADNRMVLFESNRPAAVRIVPAAPVRGRLVGLDFRPADGKLYAVSDAHEIYTLDPATGAARRLATLTVPWNGGARSGVDFNPQTDRLRLVGANGQNVRAHASLGAAALDGPLVFGRRDKNAGKRPHSTAAAYTRSLPKTPKTLLFEIDADLDILMLQDPPNDGVLTTVGPLGVDFGPAGGFDILTDGDREIAYAASGSTLYSIDLATGAATRAGEIGPAGPGTERLGLIGLTIRLRPISSGRAAASVARGSS